MSSPIKTNSLKAWLLAIRPKTLTGAAAPVLIALALLWSDINIQHPSGAVTFQWIPATLCLLFALLMQVDANLINDYFDYVRGIDGEERLGPKRACAQGWITLPAMQRGIAFTTCLSLTVGFPTVFWGGMEMLFVGILCALFAFLYTTRLARIGMGDLLVLVFFGIVPVCITYYVQLHTVTQSVLSLGVAMGLVTDNLLIVNNYRDRDTDRQSHKNTLVVSIGAKASEWLYLGLGIAGIALCQLQWKQDRPLAALLPLLYLIPHIITWRSMVKINHGRELNKVLGKTALNIFLFAILVAAGILAKHL